MSNAPLLDQIAGMLKDVRKGKKKKPSLISKKVVIAPHIEKFKLTNPWKREALVLRMVTSTCYTCGESYTYPNPIILIRRCRRISGKEEIHEEELPLCNPDAAYSNIPRIIETLSQDVPACHFCFPHLKPEGEYQHQLSLPFTQ